MRRSDTPSGEAKPTPPFDMIEGYCFVLWMWETFPHDLIAYAKDYAIDKEAGRLSWQKK